MKQVKTEDGESFLQMWREMDAPRRKWNRRCWAAGLVAIVTSLGGCTAGHVIYVERTSPTLLVFVNACSVISMIVGCLLIALGPISWYWIYRSNQVIQHPI